MPLVRYYPSNCPRCGPEGEMFISRRMDTGALCFSCDECNWTCDRPADLGVFENGYEGFKLQFTAPTKDEIEGAGWGEYCTHAESRPE